jgi:hypothetical protein
VAGSTFSIRTRNGDNWGTVTNNLKVILPLSQAALAALLLRQSFLYDAATRLDDSRGVHPAFTLLLLVNFPVCVLLRELLIGRMGSPWFSLLILVVVAGFWFGIAEWVSSYRKRGSIFPAQWRWLRISADLFLIGMGGLLSWATPWSSGTIQT